ncbi:hypothetical protein FN846DRAFT_361460 [Sphaerosporella brunnea]|uniref:Uncharacterized protein n=1 Tax=Sphaerosporella brunnea TaxID=1250544 RepID=A0A5J5F5V6_9PEZI|nr:hypothetical protein FN846DRAFT_361460 [Sphaerosporella brunnea]
MSKKKSKSTDLRKSKVETKPVPDDGGTEPDNAPKIDITSSSQNYNDKTIEQHELMETLDPVPETFSPVSPLSVAKATLLVVLQYLVVTSLIRGHWPGPESAGMPVILNVVGWWVMRAIHASLFGTGASDGIIWDFLWFTFGTAGTHGVIWWATA